MSEIESQPKSSPELALPAPEVEPESVPEPEAAPVLEPTSAGEPEVLYCPQCGDTMDPDQRYCTNCGWDAEAPDDAPPAAPPESPRDLGPASNKNRLTALLLCALIGWLGLHRFYIGRPGSGVVWLLTLGFLGVGVIYDAVMLATGELVDGEGKRVLHWH